MIFGNIFDNNDKTDCATIGFITRINLLSDTPVLYQTVLRNLETYYL